MPGIRNHVWVSTALCDEDVTKVLVLGFSLRRTNTTRKLAVIASPKLSLQMKQLLSRGFEYVFYLDEQWNTAGLPVNHFSKIYSFSALKAFDICAYLSPTMMALKNCDELFAKFNGTTMFLDHPEDISVFLFKPSVDQFESLMEWMEDFEAQGIPFGALLRKWGEKIWGDSGSTIPEKYSKDFLRNKPLFGLEEEFAMVNILESPNEFNMYSKKKEGTLEELVIMHWHKIQREDILPLIHFPNKVKNSIVDSAPKPVLSYEKPAIAIVGMSCRYPGSNTLEEFWNLLFQGGDGTIHPPEFRWRNEQCSIHRANARNVTAGFLKVPVDTFDAKFFGISPKEAEFMDPQHRLLHELVWEGLEDACVNPQTLRGTSGSVFVGSWINDYKEILKNTANSEFYRSYMGNSIGAAAARISFLLGMTGPSISTESGCSSAMVAVHMACQALQLERSNLAIACGANLLLNQFDKDEIPMVISPDGKSRTFSIDANGFARAEGGGVLVLKRLPDALRDRDHIWGVIRGSAISQEGISKSMGTPTVHCESLAMKEALQDADLAPHHVSYVEAHGTGTVVGDPMEVAAIAVAYNTPKRKQPLIIGSVKTNVGHTESCSGITGIMKVILAMRHELIPAHRNFSKLNPSIDLNAVPAVIPLQSIEWKKSQGKQRFAGVSSFGITGTDAHMIIEEPPQTNASNILSLDSSFKRPKHILKLSTKTEEAMNILLEKYRASVQNCDHSLEDIAFSANTGRADFFIRAAIIGEQKEDISRAIQEGRFLRGGVTSETGKICFLFTGQGSQYSGMAKTLYYTSPVFRMHFDHCNKILDDMYGINICKILWENRSNPEHEVSRTIYSQTSIFCVEYALLKLWESWGLKPDFVLGHSLGEFCAAICAGILSIEDAIKLVAVRSQLIDKLPRGKMLVIKANHHRVDELLKQFYADCPKIILDYAAINSDEQTVLAGDSDEILTFSKFCSERYLKTLILESTHAFHSRHMDPMLEEYRKIASKVTNLGGNNCKFISSVMGDQVLAKDIDANYWVQHARQKVNFLCASQKAVDAGCQVFLEIGPQPVLSALTMMNSDKNLVCLPSIKKSEDEWTTMLSTLGKLYVHGVNINWDGFYQFSNRQKVQLPHYPFIGKKFWPELVESRENSIHPLIGSAIPNASSIKLFEGDVSLKSHEWLKDHIIGQTTVFPGAALLEMCLAAGLTSIGGSFSLINKPTRPIKIENLVIQAPLALQDSKIQKLQTTIEHNTLKDNGKYSNDIKVKIFHAVKSNLETKWVSHAKSVFSPVVIPEEIVCPIEKGRLQEIISTPSDSSTIPTLYEKLSSAGLKFGLGFRSLQNLWRNDDGSILTATKLPCLSEKSVASYILHPIILDAMIQAIMMRKLLGTLKIKVYVPVKIGKFIWVSGGTPKTEEKFIYVYDNEMMTSTALLLDTSGNVLAIMSNVELIATTAKTMESVLEQQTSTMPQMWEEIWRPQTDPWQYAHDTALCAMQDFSSKQFYNGISNQIGKLNPEMTEVFKNMETLVYYSILECLYECGFEPSENLVISIDTLREQLKIQREFTKLFAYFLRVLQDEGLLENVEPDIFKVAKKSLTLQEIENELMSPKFLENLVPMFQPSLLLFNIGQRLSGIMQGDDSLRREIFSENINETPSISPAKFSREFKKSFGVEEMTAVVLDRTFDFCKQHQNSGKREILRICEIGAGTGTFSNICLELLASKGIEYEYTYTDRSDSLFPYAEQMFDGHSKSIIFKNLDIEEDPITQGFLPAYYDIIYACDMLHETKNLKKTLLHLKIMLKPQGRLDIVEMTRENRSVTLASALQNEFWNFEDVRVRPTHCTLSTDGWKELLSSCGFQVVESFSCLDQHYSLFCTSRQLGDMAIPQSIPVSTVPTKTWAIFFQDDNQVSSNLAQNISLLTNRQAIIIRKGSKFKAFWESNVPAFTINADIENDYVKVMEMIENEESIDLEGILYCWSLHDKPVTQEIVLRPFFYLCKAVLGLRRATGVKLIALIKGVAPIENHSVTNFQSSTVLGFIKSLQNERIDIKCRCIDIGDCGNQDGNIMHIFYEIWNNTDATQVAFKGNQRYVPKMSSIKATMSDLALPQGCDRFQMLLPESKSIHDLEFGPLDPCTLAEKEIEIQVKSTALNFRDVLNVLKPSEDFRNMNAVGFDFAGVVVRLHPQVTKWRIGDTVFGVNFKGKALPSHVNLHEDEVLPVPDQITLEEACTLPVVVATSYHCLIDIAKIKSTDTVLIHTATGGVGISAIQICKYIGATIIATAGSKRKQNYLRSLGIQHIFHSRNTNYGQEILQLTNGKGVDIVLNSLTSEGFKETTLKCCAIGARFVEMSKLSVWKPEEVKTLRPDVDYTIVDVSQKDNYEWQYLLTKLEELYTKKVVSPIPYVRFNAVNIREALQFMQKAKHIGKVVCTMPEIRRENGECKVYTPIFNARSTYLITGGLGGIGFQVCKWMVSLGAKYVLLAGRNFPSSTTLEEIARLNSKFRSKVKSVTLDVSRLDQCEQLIYIKIREYGYPPLRGIMHAAGTLNDGLIENQTWEKLSSTFNSKIQGTLNLHEVTKTGFNLEHFVLFSSVAATLGSPGQSNHSAGNQFEDTFAHYRQSIGMPATSINWGQWGEVGIATEIDLPGMKPFSNIQGISGLEYALKSHRTQTVIFNVESFALLSKLYPHLNSYLDEQVDRTTANKATSMVSLSTDKFWQEYESNDSWEEKFLILKDKVRMILKNVLNMDNTEDLADSTDFQDIGVDSLMFVEIKNSLQTLVGNRTILNASHLKECNNLQLLSTSVVQMIEGVETSSGKVPSKQEIRELLKEDCILPEHIRAKPGQRAKNCENISTVLLTGVTGMLGPFILKELSQLEQITKIVCLIRPKRHLTSEERLAHILDERGITLDVNMTKVLCICGNVANANLGMNEENWSDMVNSIDAVVHCAALVQHVEHYREKKTQNCIRTINIDGLKNVLEFCCAGNKLKHVYVASTILAVASLDEEGNISEDWPEFDDFAGVCNFAYPITKFAGEVIMKEAVTKRGIPGKVFRFPFISGDSKSSRFVLEKNHLMLRFVFMMKNGIMGSNPLPLVVLPVDTCAKYSVALFLDPNAPFDVYNIVNCKVDTDQEFVSVAKRLGYEIKTVDFAEFAKRIANSNDPNSPMAAFKDFYVNEEEFMSFYATVPVLKQWVLNGGINDDFFKSKKLSKIIPEFYRSDVLQTRSKEFIYNDLLYAKHMDLLKKFGV